MIKKIIHLAISIAFASLFLWIIFRSINLIELFAAFNKANFFLISLSVIAFLVGYGCRIERWRIMLTLDNPKISWKECSALCLQVLLQTMFFPLEQEISCEHLALIKD